MNKEITNIDLVEGGNVVKQGDYFTIGYRPRNAKGEAVDLVGKSIAVEIFSKDGIAFESTGEFDPGDGLIYVHVNKNIGYGNMFIEFTVTDPNDATYRLKFPTNNNAGRLTIHRSTDDLEYVGVKMVTVEQLKADQRTFEQSVDGKVETLQQRVETGIGAFTSSTEILDARGGEVNLRARLDKTTAQLADTKSQIEINYPYLTNFHKALAKGNAIVAFLGDSTTEDNTTNNNTAHPKYLQNWFDTKYGVGKVTVINAGVSGNDLSLMANRVARDVINKNPDAVVICSGWNDNNLGTFDIFEYRYNTIIEIIKAGSTKPVDIVLRTPNYSSNAEYVKPMDDNVVQLTEKVAKRNNVGLVDYFYYSKTGYQNGTIILDPSAPNTTMADFIHPNQIGQELIGNFLKPMFDTNGKLGKALNGVATKYSGLYIEATDTSLVNNNGYAISTTDAGHIRSKRLATSSAFPNKVATLNFYGSTVKVVVKSGKNMGMINVSIDGAAPIKHDLYEVQRNTVGVENFKVIEISGLSNAPHTVAVTSLAEKNATIVGNAEVYIEGFIVEESSFYAYKFKNEATAVRYEAVVRYSSADSATKTTTVGLNATVLAEFDYTIVNESRYIQMTDKACTIEQAGLYVIDASVTLANAVARGYLQVMRNGGFLAQQSFYFDDVAGDDRTVKVYAVVRLNVGDKITLQVRNLFQSTALTIKSYNNPALTGMKVYKVGS